MPNSTIIQDILYDGYDKVGNITHIEDRLNINRSETFEYDELNRLIRANSPMYGDLRYIYDAEDRLKEVNLAGVTKESYWYDFSGERSVKLREDDSGV